MTHDRGRMRLLNGDATSLDKIGSAGAIAFRLDRQRFVRFEFNAVFKWVWRHLFRIVIVGRLLPLPDHAGDLTCLRLPACGGCRSLDQANDRCNQKGHQAAGRDMRCQQFFDHWMMLLPMDGSIPKYPVASPQKLATPKLLFTTMVSLLLSLVGIMVHLISLEVGCVFFQFDHFVSVDFNSGSHRLK